jgi:dipeptidyl aminopeptidase/acylaminoacyl peptidase
VRELDLPFSAFRHITAQGTAVVCVAGGPSSEPVVLRVDVDGGEPEIIRPARDLGLDPAWFSRPEHVVFPTADDGTGIDIAHALVYPPTSPEAHAPDGERPPLLVHVHGGPTSAATPVLNLDVQYWTSRGFCVADVATARRSRDAGGSSTWTTSSPVPDTSPTRGGWTRPGWPSAADRPAASRRSRP